MTNRLIRSILAVAVSIYIALGLPALVLACLLVSRGETIQGRLFGVAALVLFPVPVLLWIVALVGSRRRAVLAVAACLTVSGVALIAACYCMTPDGMALPGAAAESLYTGTAKYVRWSPANLVPEIDQLKLGTYVFPQIDPFIDDEQARRIRKLFLELYREMRKSDEFTRLGSILGLNYRDAFMGSRQTGHFYRYLPEAGSTNGPLPVILFLHGSLGNFKGYLWLWKKFSDAQGYAIVAPTFGAGNWDREGGLAEVERALKQCADDPRLDENRVILCGLSNGGKAVSRAGAAYPQAFAGLVFLSPIMEIDVLGSDQFVRGWAGRSVAVIHGLADRRIPERCVDDAVSVLRREGVRVTTHFYPGEDHFLFFSQPGAVLSNVADYCREL